MSLGGRPKEEGGHKAFNISIDTEIQEGLSKINDKDGNRSKFIENAIRPHIRQLDPGPSCKVLDRIDKTLDCEIRSALARKDFEKTATLATIGNTLRPFRCLCKVPTKGVQENSQSTLECGEKPPSLGHARKLS